MKATALPRSALITFVSVIPAPGHSSDFRSSKNILDFPRNETRGCSQELNTNATISVLIQASPEQMVEGEKIKQKENKRENKGISD